MPKPRRGDPSRLGAGRPSLYRLTTETVIGGLADVCVARLVAALALLEQLAFAYLICNGDAHAKNFSVLRTSGEWRVTPAYDVPTSYVYGDHTVALDEILERTELWIDELGSLPFDAGVLRELRRAIEYRRDRLVGEVERTADCAADWCSLDTPSAAFDKAGNPPPWQRLPLP